MKNKTEQDDIPWINPIGGLGDMLMVSGVLKLKFDADPTSQFNLVRRVRYTSIFKGHPAINQIGFPGKDARIMGTNYWNMEEFSSKNQRTFQILARMYGLNTPVEEKLYLPGGWEDDPMLHSIIPWQKWNVLIAPKSDSPRKEMHPPRWHELVDRLLHSGAFVAQAGLLGDIHIRNAYSLLGLTTPRQIVSLLRQFQLVITSDNFIMHSAYMVGTKAIVLWGPTDHKIYGYPGQIHFQADKICDASTVCIGPEGAQRVYTTQCPLEEHHCMNQINLTEIANAARNTIG
jgi:ADP-heptose:LPS heptosyltransferase